MKLRTLIIDDEPLARKGIREYVSEVDFLELAGECDSALQAAGFLSSGEIHLVLLDIQMPKLTGLDFIKSMPDPPPFIFTTAYPEFALEGFELSALDYLVKPISFDRFFKAALKTKDYYELRQVNAQGNAAGHFFIKVDQKLVRLNFDEIRFVEAMQNYVVLHCTGRKYISYLTLGSVENFLPADRFLKVHKSYIVALDKVESIEGTDIRIGPDQIPISRSLKDEVMEKLLGGRFLKR